MPPPLPSVYDGALLTTGQLHRIASRAHPHSRNIALFGGSFDPIHNGHLAVARAADRRFNFDEILFIPASRPPHKHRSLAPFPHRYAMVSLACAEHPHFVPSLAEAGEDFSAHQLFYSIDTVRHFRRAHHHLDHIYFIIGADAFIQIATWKEYEALLMACNFIVATRPGVSADALRLVIPPELFARPQQVRRHSETHAILPVPHDPHVLARLRRSTIFLLDTVMNEVSSTGIRRRVHRGQSIHGLVSARVEEYIGKQGLYR
jgi:nicotinate-nucleotide adenylyltransferase